MLSLWHTPILTCPGSLPCQLLISLDRIGCELWHVDNTAPIVTLIYHSSNVPLLYCLRHAPSLWIRLPNAIDTAFPAWIRVQSFFSLSLNGQTTLCKELHCLSAFNNEVLVGTIILLFPTRTDPWRDFLVVMVLMQLSLPQQSGSVDLYYIMIQAHWI